MPRSLTLGAPAARRTRPSQSGQLAQAVAATAELCGHTMSPAAAELLAHDLARFDLTAVRRALARCRIELRGALTIGEILARVDDGRPGADEAWSMVPASEAASVVWTAEMAQAWGSALPLLQSGDAEAARKAFHEAYAQHVLLARCRREAVRWTPSLGTDPLHRERVLREAVQKERLPVSYVESLLPYRSLSPQAHHLLGRVHLKNIP